MSTYTKVKLSGSTDGKAILVDSTSVEKTIHTAIAGTTSFDEIWIWAQNNHTADVLLTVSFGGTADPGDHIIYTVPFKDGLKIIAPGLLLQNGALITSIASVASVVSLTGFVNRIS